MPAGSVQETRSRSAVTEMTQIQMGSVAYDMAYVPIRTTVFFAMTTLLFGTHFYWSGLLPTFAILAGLIPFVWGLGILAASYTIRRSYRAEGEVAGVSRVQLVPSQVHVSPRYVDPLQPPKRTTSALAASYAMPKLPRTPGEVGGMRCVQVAPSQVHVSPR